MKKFNLILTKQKNENQIFWVSIIRFVAIFMVFASHIADNVPMAERSSDAYRAWVPYYGSLMRACVPLFIMLTGFLSFKNLKNGASIDMATFYKKRIPRIVVPFVFWVVVFNLFAWFIVTVLKADFSIVKLFFAWADPATASVTFSGGLLQAFQSLFFNFNVFATHLWYVFALIGLYLYMPIFSAWVEKASLKSKLIFLAIWGVTLFYPYLREVNPNLYPEAHYLHGACSWNEFGMLYSFAGFNGYLLLGHLLGEAKSLNLWKTLIITTIMFVSGYIVTVIGFSSMLHLEGATELQIEMFYTYCSPNVVAMTIAVFLFFKKIGEYNTLSCIKSFFATIDDCGYGIFLIHYIFLGPFYKIALDWPLPTPVKMTIACIFSMASCWFFVWICKKIKGSKWIFG